MLRKLSSQGSNEASNLIGRLRLIEKKYGRGIVRLNDYLQENNKVRMATLELIDEQGD